MRKPYIAKVAYYVLPEEEFDEVLEALEDNSEVGIIVKEVNDGGMYYEFEPEWLKNKKLPIIGDIGKLNVDIVHIWLDN